MLKITMPIHDLRQKSVEISRLVEKDSKFIEIARYYIEDF